MANEALLAPLVPTPSDRYDYRPRSYDVAVLRYVGYYRYVTVHQILYRFWVYDGKGPGYGYRLIRRLKKAGLLAAEPLDPEMGRAAREVVTLTPDGWRSIGLSPPAKSRRSTVEAVREYRLQFAEVMLDREAEGWQLVPAAKTFDVVRGWALRPFRGRMLNSTEAVLRERIERMPHVEIGLRVLKNLHTEDVRFLLPVRRGRSYKKKVESLPDLPLLPPVEVEMVCSDVELATPAEGYIKRWARQARTKAAVHRVAHFRTRENPNQATVPAESYYETNGAGDPRTYL